ncbi:hypothetical protein [Moorena sp. SIO2C4]|uniref:hypothetical protein n=1 Tax=Moorena sp. SIO2C4 TaxID=2607824 RepID=UPI0013BEEFA2|nr:hypothetical protein [Moorena sp. SIO2C4]NEQ16931.1 hypothetical protein [Moorena sp. SIO3E2]NES44566.1 hypothetical protein [Moorena sp. SIO2C4]
MPVPPRCRFHLTLKIIPLLSNAEPSTFNGLTFNCITYPTPNAKGEQPPHLQP